VTRLTLRYAQKSACGFYPFQDDSMKRTLWGSQFIRIESACTCIDNTLGFSLNSFAVIVCYDADHQGAVYVMMCNKSLMLMYGLHKYNIHPFFQKK
jgi:hypothetical protein